MNNTSNDTLNIYVESLSIPQQLKTLEIDVAKKMFKLNGQNFGKGCGRITITCDAGKARWEVTAILDQTLVFAFYDRQGNKITKQEYDNK